MQVELRRRCRSPPPGPSPHPKIVSGRCCINIGVCEIVRPLKGSEKFVVIEFAVSVGVEGLHHARDNALWKPEIESIYTFAQFLCVCVRERERKRERERERDPQVNCVRIPGHGM